jgi:NADH:ubiquinone oxidoreductase subunit F (NADH-binding)
VLLGGWAGTWLPWHVARGAALAGASRHPATGAGLVSPLPPGGCGLAETARILRYLARSGAGQCGPCVFGLPALADTAERLAGDRARRRDVVRLRRDAAEVDGRGACSHPDGAVRLLTTALATFAADVDAHTATGRCLEKGPAR